MRHGRSTLATTKRGAIMLATALALGLASDSAHAAPTPEQVEHARQLDENARTLYDEGSYEAAIVAWKRAYELTEFNNMLYNISLAYDRMQDFEKALEYLDRYRALAPPAEREQLERRKKSLQVRLEKQREAADDQPDDDATDEADAPVPTPPVESPPAQPRLFTPAAWALTGTAAAGFGVAIGFGSASLVATRRAKDGCGEAGDTTLCTTDVQRDVSRARTFAIVTDVGIAVGAVATAALIAVLVTTHKRRKRASTTAWTLQPHRGGAAWSWRF